MIFHCRRDFAVSASDFKLVLHDVFKFTINNNIMFNKQNTPTTILSELITKTKSIEAKRRSKEANKRSVRRNGSVGIKRYFFKTTFYFIFTFR